MLLVGYYIATSLSYTVPAGDPYKEATGALRDIARPYFAQGWNVFAPNILKSNVELEIRAQWRDDSGGLVHSDWFSASQLELNAVAGMPAPARTSKQSWNLIRAYNTRFVDLTEEQREIFQDTWIRFRNDTYIARPEAEVIAELDSLGDNPSEVRTAVRYDAVMVEYATYLATAYFGEEIERVRWRVVYDRPNDFEHRHQDERQFELTDRGFGWRQAATDLDDDALGVYREFVDRNRTDG